ncbi:MAG: hypothetical protein OXI96_09025 [Acidimicrobiaceae bacterium]|nr:hypothetical protein [Acidimicrobiaceae bacterium]
MVVTPKIELERMELTSQLEETLGTDTARTLMAHIPPVNIEQLATKDDLIMVKKDIDKDIDMVKKDIDMVRKDIDIVRNEVKMVETRLNNKIDTKTAELDTKIDRLNTKMDAGFKEIRSEMVLEFAQQSKKIFVIGLSLALPTWIALIGVLITLVITIISL